MFSALFNYVAFWPGKRSFLVSADGGAFQQASELSGRLAFGIGALMLDVIIIFVLASGQYQFGANTNSSFKLMPVRGAAKFRR